MKWHLDFPLERLTAPADFQDKMILAGSCFAQNIGDYLTRYKLDALINPHGILYNPASIVQSLEACLEKRLYGEKDLHFHHGLWHCWDHHERFSRADPQECLDGMNAAVEKAHSRLLQADWLIITLGSAGIYRLKKGHRIAGNCHKYPAEDFDFSLMTPAEAMAALDGFIHRLFHQNPRIRLIFTVSPVRYIRYGLTENNLSKSVLLYAVHQLVNKFDRLHYFPAYEIVIDELRDYRFFAGDLVHPNEQAIGYVWDKFVKYFMSPGAEAVIREIHPVIQAAGHRPLHAGSPDHDKFIRAQLEKIARLEYRYPFLNFDPEKATLTQPPD